MSDRSTGHWHDFELEAPELAAAVRSRFESAKHHVLASLRRDGSPRVSGTEVQFHDGDLVVGMMHQSVKARDLVNDGRFALHASTSDETMSDGDAKVSGLAVEVTDPSALEAYKLAVKPPPPFHLFRMSLTEVVRTSLHPDGDRLVIERWMPGSGVSRIERS